jgi:hypothetical protein
MQTSSYAGDKPDTRKCQEILSRLKISQVYEELTGTQLRRTSSGTWRGRAVWRDGDGLNVSGDDRRGVWHDFVTDEGGGILDLIVRVRGGSRAEALRWSADLAGIEIGSEARSRVSRSKLARQRRELERRLQNAHQWRRAAVAMGEALLDVLKSTLIDPSVGSVHPNEIINAERLLGRLRRLDGWDLVEEYAWWTRNCPRLTGCMVQAAQTREIAERVALEAFLNIPARQSHGPRC